MPDQQKRLDVSWCAVGVLQECQLCVPCAAHVPDTAGHVGPRSRMLYLAVVVLLVVVVAGGGIAYFLYSRKKEKERKRFY